MFDTEEGAAVSAGTRRARWALAAACALATGLLACGGGGGGGETTERSSAALVGSPDDVLGFEAPAGWSTSGASASSTPIRTQGSAALQLDTSKQLVTLTSAPVASTATALANLADPSSQLAIDVMLPKPPPNTSNPGALKLLVSSKSRGLDRVSLAQIPFFGLKPEVWNTIKFPIPSNVRSALAGAYSDLRVDLQLNTPGKAGAILTYRLDHLRVHAPSDAPGGVHQSVDLVALRTYAPASSAPGTASFDVGVVQVPKSFHVKTGSSKTGSAKLELGFGSTPFVTCTYAGSNDGTSYEFGTCSNAASPGDLLGSDFARLTILGGDPSMGPTKVRAQLALNPVGDVTGSGVIPPMPTFWGDTPDSANQIVTSYFDAVHAVPSTEPLQIATPVPDFARRFGDGAPHDNLSGQPPPASPLDPPFDFDGHLNAGGNWDAYWQLVGNLTPERLTDNRFKNHFEATASANVVVWGYDVPVVSVKALADSDSGEVNATGLNQPTASGSVSLYLFGLQMVKRDAKPSEQFSFSEQFDHTFDVAKVQIWIFQIALQVKVGASFTADGTVTPVDVAFAVTPEGAIGAIVSGGINLGVASGVVAADVDLLRLQTPVRARASWYLSTDPAVCSARLFVDLTGNATLSSLGGKIDLKATYGVCPLCSTDSYNIFKWDPLAEKDYSLFDYKLDGQLFPLPAAVCVTPLTVTIVKPVDAEKVSSGVPYALQGKAVRPATVGVDEQPIDCSRLQWTSSDPSDTGFPATGCTPQVTFGNTGSRTLTLAASSAAGETGSTTRTFEVVGAPTGPSPYITSPADGSTFGVFSCSSGDVPLAGGAVGGTGATSLTWSIAPLTSGATPLTITNATSTNATLVLPGTSGGQQPTNYRITLTATDEANLSNSTSIDITTSCFL